MSHWICTAGNCSDCLKVFNKSNFRQLANAVLRTLKVITPLCFPGQQIFKTVKSVVWKNQTKIIRFSDFFYSVEKDLFPIIYPCCLFNRPMKYALFGNTTDRRFEPF